tara:strand:+ start:1033 stop:1146 length:114 start_codon:yes stop_codon:yes gene_type:complete
VLQFIAIALWPADRLDEPHELLLFFVWLWAAGLHTTP